MRLSVDVHKGEALITFDQAYTWISLPPTDARKIGQALIKAADTIEAIEQKPEGKLS